MIFTNPYYLPKNSAASQEKAPFKRPPRPSDQTAQVALEILGNDPTPVLSVMNHTGQPSYQVSIGAVSERANIAQLANLFKTAGTNDSEMPAICAAIAAIPLEARVLTVQYALALTTDAMDGVQKSYVINTVQELGAKLGEDLRARYVCLAKNLITPTMDIQAEVVDILAAIHDILTNVPYKEKAAIVSHVNSLINRQMTARDVRDILEMVTGLSAEESVDIIPLVRSLINETLTAHEITSVIEQVRALPDGERADIVQHASFLVTRTMDRYGIYCILKTLKKLSHEERRVALYVTGPVFEEMNGFDKKCCLKALIPVPVSERQSIIGLVQKLSAEPQHRAEAITALHSIPEETRQQAVKLAHGARNSATRVNLLSVQRDD